VGVELRNGLRLRFLTSFALGSFAILSFVSVINFVGYEKILRFFLSVLDRDIGLPIV
jgi:hypothetical protein